MYNEMALPLVRAMLIALDRIGELKNVSIDTTAQMLFGVVCDASTTVAMAEQPDEVALEVEQVMLFMLGGLRKSTGRDSRTSPMPARWLSHVDQRAAG